MRRVIPFGAPPEDDEAVCPTCCDYIDSSDLCKHDDPERGPLCGPCCGYWHGKDVAA